VVAVPVVLFGGANQLMASLALMLVTAWLMSEGKSYAWTFYPMILCSSPP